MKPFIFNNNNKSNKTVFYEQKYGFLRINIINKSCLFADNHDVFIFLT